MSQKKAVLTAGQERFELQHNERTPTSAGVLGYSDDARGVWFMVDDNVVNPPRPGEISLSFNEEWQDPGSELWLKPDDTLHIQTPSGSYDIVFEELVPADEAR